MFRWGPYASSTAVLSFAIGLRWGAVGVACAYAVGEYVLRLPVLYLTVQRVGPVTAFDLVALQGSLLAAAGFTVLISDQILRPHALSGIYLVAATVALSYGLAAGFLALLPRSRAAMHETFSLRPLRMLAPKVPGAPVLVRRGSWRMFRRPPHSGEPRPGERLQAAADPVHFNKPSK
jgi:hypothetical protein